MKFNIFFYINFKIRPTSTMNTIINIRSMPNSTTKENQRQQKFLFSLTTICLTTNIGHQLRQQNTFNNLGTNDWLWSREVGTQKFKSQGMVGNRGKRKQTWRPELLPTPAARSLPVACVQTSPVSFVARGSVQQRK